MYFLKIQDINITALTWSNFKGISQSVRHGGKRLVGDCLKAHVAQFLDQQVDAYSGFGLGFRSEQHLNRSTMTLNSFGKEETTKEIKLTKIMIKTFSNVKSHITFDTFNNP